jgi:hypothetical protein
MPLRFNNIALLAPQEMLWEGQYGLFFVESFSRNADHSFFIRISEPRPDRPTTPFAPV